MNNKILCMSSLGVVLALSGCVASVEESSDDELGAAENVSESAQALSDVTLTPGQSATFPTWCCWGWTSVEVTNQGSSWGCVKLQVGGAWEYLCAPGGGNNGVARQWAGGQLQVSNDSSSTFRVKVW